MPTPALFRTTSPRSTRLESLRAKLRRAVLLVAALLVGASVAPATALAGNGTIQGKVLGGAGGAGVSASVQLQDANTGYYVTSATTDSAGAYSLSAAAGTYRVFASPIQPALPDVGYLSRYFPSAQLASDAQSITLAADQTVTGKDVTLARAAGISGTVTDDSGTALAGVTVAAEPYPYSPNGTWGSATTAADGTFTVRGLQEGSYRVRFNTSAGTHVAQYWPGVMSSNDASTVYASTGAATAHVDAELDVAATISGTVKDAAATGLANVSVRATGDEQNAISYYGTSTANGAYSVKGLPAGTYTLYFAPASGAKVMPATRAAKVTVTRGQAVSGIDQTLLEGGKITGTVRTSTGPIAGVNVQANPVVSSNYTNFTATTAADGTYTISGLPQGSYRVSFSGYGSASIVSTYYNGKDFSNADPVTSGPGVVTTGIDATVVRSATISGTVKRPDGTTPSFNEATVTAYWAGSGSSVGSLGTSIGSNGSFSIAGLRPGKWVLRFGGPAYLNRYYPQATTAAAATEITVGEGETKSGYELTLVAGGTLSGKATDAGTPLAYGIAGIFTAESIDSTAYVPQPLATAAIGSTGTYSFTGLETGKYVVGVQRGSSSWYSWNSTEFHGGGSQPADADPVQVTAPQATTGIDVAFKKRGAISGKVSPPAGKTLEWANATVHRVLGDGTTSNEALGSSSTAQDGTYTVRDLPAGRYVVRFSGGGATGSYLDAWNGDASTSEDAAPITVSDETTASAVNATLKSGGTITGTVKNASGTGLGNAYVWVELSDDQARYGDADEHGAFVVPGVPDGTYTANISASGYVQQRKKVVIAGGTAAPIDVVLAPTAKLSGKVTRPDGTPVADANVLVYGTDDDEGYTSAFTSLDGTWQLNSLPPGTYRVAFVHAASRTVWWDGAAGAFAPAGAELLDLQSGQSKVLNATLPLGAEIKGTVKYGYGGTVSYAAVQLLDASGEPVRSMTTGYDGTFRFQGIAEGNYKVRVSTYAPYLPTFNGDAATFAAAPVIAASVAAPAASQTITLRSDVTGTSPTTPTTPTTPTGTVSGRIVDPQGTPIASAYVYLSGTSPSGASVFTSATAGPDGRYTASVPAGTYRVYSSGSYSTGAKRYLTRYYPGASKYDQATTVSVVVGQSTTGIDITLPPAASLAGTVVDPDGKPVANAAVTVYFTSSDYLTAYLTTEKGRFRIPGLEPGAVKIQVIAPSGSGLSNRWLDDADTFADATPVTLVSDQTTTKTATLNRGGQISGVVRDARGAAVAGATVSALNESGGRVRTIRTRSDGSYRLLGLSKATYRVRFVPPSSRPELIARYSGDVATFADAAKYAITRASDLTGIDATLPAGATLRGTVTAGGEPAVGVRVSAKLVTDDTDDPDEGFTTTDDDGKYEVVVPEGKVRVRFWGDGYLTKESATQPTTNVAAPTTLNETLTRASSISGQVTDPSGNPIGTSGYSSYPDVTLLDADGDFVARTKAGGDTGHYRFGGLAAGTYYAKFAAVGRAGESYDDQPWGERGTPIVIGTGEHTRHIDARLARGGSISGKLTASDGELIQWGGVTVRARNAAGKVVGETSSSIVGYSGSDDEAWYDLDGLPAGPVTIEFDGTQYADEDDNEPFVREYFDNSPTLAGATPVQVTADDSARADAQLTRQAPVARGTIAGKVTGPSGPIQGAVVQIHTLGGDEVDDAETAADGTYSIPGLRPGKYLVEIFADGYKSEYYDNTSDVDLAAQVTVTSSQTTTINAQLAPAPAVLKGTVAKPGGAPAASVTVSVFPAASTADTTPLASTTTDAGGAWLIDTLPAGSYKLRVSATGFKTQFYAGKSTLADATPVTLVAGDATIVPEITLVALPGSIAGTVTAAGGGGLVGAAVTAYDSATGAVKASTTTGAGGSYTLADLAPGNYKVGFAAAGRSPGFNGGAATLAAATAIAITPGQAVTGIDAALTTPPATTGSIAGTVKDAAGAPLPGATVTLYDGSQIVGAAVTLAAGTFRFDALAPTTAYALRFEAPGKVTEFHAGKATLDAATRLTVIAGATTTADAALAAKPAVLRGRVTDAAGALSGATVTLYAATGTATVGDPVTTGGSGTFEFSRPAGSYRIGVTKSGYGTRFYDAKGSLADASVVVAGAGETKDDLDIRLTSLTAPGTLSGRVRAVGGAALGGASIAVKTHPAGATVKTVTADTDGRWSVQGLAPGTYVVTAAATGHEPAATAPITLEPAATSAGHDLTLAPTPAGDVPGGQVPGGETPGDETAGGGDQHGQQGGGQTGGGQAGTQPPGGGTPKSDKVAPPTVGPQAKKKLPVAKGAVVVALGCAAGATCSATATLQYQPPKAKKSKKKPPPVVIGTSSVNLTAGGQVTITLNPKGKKLLNAAPKSGLKVTLLITPAGAKTPSSTTSLTLAAASRGGGKKAATAALVAR